MSGIDTSVDVSDSSVLETVNSAIVDHPHLSGSCKARSLHIPRREKDGLPKGFAFLYFDRQDDCDALLRVNLSVPYLSKNLMFTKIVPKVNPPPRPKKTTSSKSDDLPDLRLRRTRGKSKPKHPESVTVSKPTKK